MDPLATSPSTLTESIINQKIPFEKQPFILAQLESKVVNI
jgi:hypothetical protein